MLDLIERSVRSARTARSPVLYLGNKLCLPNVHHLEAGRADCDRAERLGSSLVLGGSPAKAVIALPALHRSEASGLRRPRRGVGERSRDLFGRGDDLPHQTMARVHEALLDRVREELEERREESA